MLQNGQLRFIAQDGVENVGGIAYRNDHRLGAILRELIRGPTVKGASLAIAERRWKRTGVTILTRHRQALTIRGGKDAEAPHLAEGQLMMVVDQSGKSRLKRVFSHVPRRAPRQLPIRDVR